MPVIKKLKQDVNYVQVPNETARNKELSPEARGILIELLSYPEDWEIHKESLYCEGMGREKLNRIIKELRTKKYLFLIDIRDPKGRIIDRVWCPTPKSSEPDTVLTELSQPKYGFALFKSNPNEGFSLNMSDQPLQRKNNKDINSDGVIEELKDEDISSNKDNFTKIDLEKVKDFSGEKSLPNCQYCKRNGIEQILIDAGNHYYCPICQKPIDKATLRKFSPPKKGNGTAERYLETSPYYTNGNKLAIGFEQYFSEYYPELSKGLNGKHHEEWRNSFIDMLALDKKQPKEIAEIIRHLFKVNERGEWASWYGENRIIQSPAKFRKTNKDKILYYNLLLDEQKHGRRDRRKKQTCYF